ncbi:MAG: ATP-dependent Clp protease proteolytic subunit [Pseudomonadota bacterium]
MAAITLAQGSLFSNATSAQTEDNCLIWHDPEIDGIFTPAVIEIRLNGDVGSKMENQLFGILQDHLTSYPTLKTIKILISSDGGYVESGFRIHNYLRGLHERHGLQVVTHNTGSVQSSAVDIYCSGNQRIASPYSYFMVHNSSREIDGEFDVEAIKDFAEEDELGTAASHQIFSACTTIPIKDVDDMFAEQTYLDPDMALELGLAHSITPATYDRSADIRCSIDPTDLLDEGSLE